MHHYIDSKLRTDFSKVEQLTIDTVANELNSVYKVKNILDDGDAIYEIAYELLDDIKSHRANYKSYIEVGMDVRVLMELRKSAILPMCKELDYFYGLHSKCDTVQQIKEVRRNFIHSMCEPYKDLDWQYYFYIKYFLGKQVKEMRIDFESCYEDGNWQLEKNPDIYLDEYVQEHLPFLDTKVDMDMLIPERRRKKMNMLLFKREEPTEEQLKALQHEYETWEEN